MKLISNRALREFIERYPSASAPLHGWRKVIEKGVFTIWADLRQVFGSADKVGDKAVFDIGGNKYRLIAHIRFEKQIIYIKAVLTHEEYDRGDWKK